MRVRSALETILASLPEGPADDFERGWISTGAADLYEATMGRTEVLAAAVGQFDS